MSKLTLNFIYAYPLDRERRILYENKNLPYPTMDEVQKTISNWQEIWTEADEKYKIIEHLSILTNRTPERNLECFVFGSGLNPMSTPFLLPIWNKERERRSDENFIDTVIHELLHVFQSTDNKKYWEMIREKYPDEEPLCRNHILLYAMLYEIYQNLFDKEPIDFGRDDLPKGYARAIELVHEVGYRELISEYNSINDGEL